MSDTHILKKFNHQQIPDILQELELSDEQFEKVEQCKNDMQIISYLVDDKLFEQAVKFLSLGLPAREGIWWSYISAEDVEKENECEKTKKALGNVHKWVKFPTEDKRRLAEKLAEDLELYTPTSWASMAVFWSGGSIVPEGKLKVEPEHFMCGEAIFNSISLAAELSDDAEAKIELYLKRGLHIAMGGNGRIGVEEKTNETNIKES